MGLDKMTKQELIRLNQDKDIKIKGLERELENQKRRQERQFKELNQAQLSVSEIQQIIKGYLSNQGLPESSMFCVKQCVEWYEKQTKKD